MAERRKNKRRAFGAASGPPGGGPGGGSARTGPAPSPRGSRLRPLAALFGLPAASALLLTLAFPPLDLSPLAYVALAPLLVMMARARGAGDAFWGAIVGGLVFFGINLYWVAPITAAGYAALIPYMAVYWAVFGWGVRRIGGTARVPLTILAPVLWVALEFVRGWALSGLPWLFVAHTQYANLTLIQTADAVGAYGASFLCLMTSGLAADFLVRPLVVPRGEVAGPVAEGQAAPPGRVSRTLVLMVALTAAAWAATVGYGVWRLGEKTSRPGPVVAAVQTCVPQDTKNIVKSEQMQTAQDIRRQIERIAQIERDMLADQFRLTEEAVAQARADGLKADLVVWPETMVPGIMNQTFLDYNPAALADYPDLARLQLRSRDYWQQVRDASRAAGAPILFGSHSAQLALGRARSMMFVNQQNTAFLVTPESKPYAAEHTYAKAHLVPFGEYLPFKESWPWLHDRLRSFTPYDYDYSLAPGGHDQDPFVMRFDGAQARFQVAICYEDAMAYRVREMARPSAPGQPKAIDFLVNISNDGWFNGSIELDQHLNLCVFRAVENRLAIVRSVNTGISALIDPTGRIEKVVQEGGRRRNITGQTVGRLTLDDRVAPYTWVGDAPAKSCVAASLVLLAVATVMRKRLAAESGQRKESAS